jgi:hypothetical protein
MQKYNIIYTAPGKAIYLWNGSGFDKLDDKERAVLLYSGISAKADEVDDALLACKAFIKKEFPGNDSLDVEKVTVTVS